MRLRRVGVTLLVVAWLWLVAVELVAEVVVEAACDVADAVCADSLLTDADDVTLAADGC